MTLADYSDSFSTLFAYRTPAVSPGIDSRSIATDELFTALIRGGAIPDGMGWVRSGHVHITGNPNGDVLRRPMRWKNSTR